MTATELKEILEKHKKWLNDEDGGERANLRYADLVGANLSGADLSDANLRGANLCNATLCDAKLRGANLREANLREAKLYDAYLRDADLRGADLDYSCLPLWCGSLNAHFDDRQIIQILYHAVKAGTESPNVSDELKEILWGLADIANKFHHVKECGRIERRKDNAELH